MTDAWRKNVRNSTFIEWFFPWYSLAVSSNNHLRVSRASRGIQTIMFNEELLSLGCHQVVVIRSRVILCQLELGRVQTAPEKGCKVQSLGQSSCLASPAEGGAATHPLPGRWETACAETQASPNTPWHRCSAMRCYSLGSDGNWRKKKLRKKYETQTFPGAFLETFTASKL